MRDRRHRPGGAEPQIPQIAQNEMVNGDDPTTFIAKRKSTQ
jgi:hypothetical protein